MIKKIPFLIAEISANHCGNFNLVKKLIKCAKESQAPDSIFATSLESILFLIIFFN